MMRADYEAARSDPAFQAEFRYELKHYVGRPTPIYLAKRLTEQCGGAQIYIKREDLNHTGAHKINNTIGPAARSEAIPAGPVATCPRLARARRARRRDR